MTMENYETWIGSMVAKKSPKPFKSGNKVNTVKAVIDHPVLPGKQAFTFVEDDSYVRCDNCKLYKDLT